MNNQNIVFFRHSILIWFKNNGREYPWRNEIDSYKILIAEMMLQRTRADQVVPVYIEFIKKFPTILSLAEADIDDIILYLINLGLPRRANRMKEAARMIVMKHDSVIPSERMELLKIPGIGEYIADAVITLAYDGHRIAIDSNVERIVTRFFGMAIKREIRRNKQFSNFCQTFTNRLKPQSVKNLNWAMIDHAALICKPKPICQKCSLIENCIYTKKTTIS